MIAIVVSFLIGQHLWWPHLPPTVRASHAYASCTNWLCTCLISTRAGTGQILADAWADSAAVQLSRTGYASLGSAPEFLEGGAGSRPPVKLDLVLDLLDPITEEAKAGRFDDGEENEASTDASEKWDCQHPAANDLKEPAPFRATSSGRR